MKVYVFCIVGLIFSSHIKAQAKVEHIDIDWPGEYGWKVAQQFEDSLSKTLVIIPGNDDIRHLSIIGNMKVFIGVENADFGEVVYDYKNALDEGSVLTVLEKQTDKKPNWVIFKIETPVISKYPEPESDLYYVVQGEYALYANWVAVKEELLATGFVKKWSAVFKNSKIVIH